MNRTLAATLLIACAPSPLRTALDAEDLAGACRASKEFGVEPDERREFQAALATTIDGEVVLAATELDLWRFEVELHTLPSSSSFHAGMPTLERRGDYVLSLVTAADIDALLPPTDGAASETPRLSPDCQPAERPHVGQIWERGFPLLHKVLSVGRGHYRDPTEAERRAQQRALAEWESGEAERVTRCAEQIATAEEQLRQRQTEAQSARTATREALEALLERHRECPSLGDEAAAWPVGVRCVYVLRATRGERRDFPSDLKFAWPMSVDIDGCRVRSQRFEYSRESELRAGIEDIFETPLSLAPSATSWR